MSDAQFIRRDVIVITVQSRATWRNDSLWVKIDFNVDLPTNKEKMLRTRQEASPFREDCCPERQEMTLRWQPWSFARRDNEATDTSTHPVTCFVKRLLYSLSFGSSKDKGYDNDDDDDDDDDDNDFGRRWATPRSFLRRYGRRFCRKYRERGDDSSTTKFVQVGVV